MTDTTRESRVYLNFFRENLTLLIIPAITFGLVAGVYGLQQPYTDHLGRLFEISYNQQNAQNQIQVADQAVSILREIKEGSVEVFKPGPLLIKIDVSGDDKEIINIESEKLSNYATSKFQLTEVGERVWSKDRRPVFLFLGFGILIGSLLGLLASLIKTYLKNY